MTAIVAGGNGGSGRNGARAGGRVARLAGDRLTVYRKQRDGRWLLARDAHTLSSVEKPES